VVHIKHGGTLLAVLSQDIQIIYETPQGDFVRVTEQAELRAHQQGVKGYFQGFTSDGMMPEDKIECTVSHSSSRTIKTGKEKNREVFHLFDLPLPISPLKFKNRPTVKRTATVWHLNAFVSKEEWFEYRTPRYPRKEITITINFHPDNPPIKEKCFAFTITPNQATLPLDIEWLTVEPDSHRQRLKVFIPYSFNERHRVFWTVRQGAVRQR